MRYFITSGKTKLKKNNKSFRDIINVKTQQYEKGSCIYGSYLQQSKPFLVFFRN